MTEPTPFHSGVGLAAIILGGLCIPLSVYVGFQSLAVTLPVFGVWYFLPLVVASIALGLFASRTATGIAGTILGVAALLLCMGFIVVDRVHGPDIRSQHSTISNAPPPGLSADQLLRAVRSATTTPAP